jgi:hypothetical protein
MLLRLAIAVLLIADATEDVRALHRRAAQRLAESWTRLERRDRRNARRAEIAVLAGWIERRRS